MKTTLGLGSSGCCTTGQDEGGRGVLPRPEYGPEPATAQANSAPGVLHRGLSVALMFFSDLIMVIIWTKDTYLYEIVKFLGDTVFQIPTQVLAQKNIKTDSPKWYKFCFCLCSTICFPRQVKNVEVSYNTYFVNIPTRHIFFK